MTGCVGIIFNEPKTKVLLVKRRDVPIWVLPGGGIDLNETPEEAVVREVKEETGLLVTVKRKIAIYTPINRLTTTSHFFECAVVSGSACPTNETRDVGFFEIQALPTPFFFIHKDFIQDALDNKSEVLHKKLTKVTYLEFVKYLATHPMQVIRFALSRFGMPWNS